MPRALEVNLIEKRLLTAAASERFNTKPREFTHRTGIILHNEKRQAALKQFCANSRPHAAIADKNEMIVELSGSLITIGWPSGHWLVADSRLRGLGLLRAHPFVEGRGNC